MPFPLRKRLEPHPVSQYDSPHGHEVFITLRTLPCAHARCKFCGLKSLDGEWRGAGPLSEEELFSQLHHSISALSESERQATEKLSLIGMAHSVITPDVVSTNVLDKGISFLVASFPNLKHLSLETRADMLPPSIVERISANSGVRKKGISLEAALGVESGRQRVRVASGKGISNKQIIEAAAALDKAGWGMRAYFIHHVPGRPPRLAAKDLEAGARFMARLKRRFPKLPLTMYVLRGYVPAELKRTFAGYEPAREIQVLNSLSKVAGVCGKHGVSLLVDVVGADEAATSAEYSAGQEIQPALIKFNATQDAGVLHSAWKTVRRKSRSP
ncbi:MAG: hypothetical protein AB1626_02090 [Candidatus Micrarchaeota archaeon]